MWFAALTTSSEVGWANRFVVKLLLGSESVAGLMEPTGGRTPTHLRIVRYRYTFTSPEERHRTGRWWNREYLGVWYPAVSLITP